jgi:uncharacterized membrane protein YeaQ/YmgE (transglycosylase-associated protein family)
MWIAVVVFALFLGVMVGYLATRIWPNQGFVLPVNMMACMLGALLAGAVLNLIVSLSGTGGTAILAIVEIVGALVFFFLVGLIPGKPPEGKG